MFVNPRKRSGAAPPKKEAPDAAADDGARRVPAQERSRKRLERILEAAALEFAEEGYEAATMEGIAARAETSIGSIYQFFPNKPAVFNALRRAYMEKLKVLFDVIMAEDTSALPWEDVLDAGIDAFAAFHETDPGFRAVWLGLYLPKDMVAEGEALNRQFADRVAVFVERFAKKMTPSERLLVATIIVETMTAMLIQAARRGPREGKALMQETKVMMRRYLAPYADDAKAAPAQKKKKRK
jgi:AcrR family transcriptional regulator